MSVNFFFKTLQSDNITLRQLGKIDAPSLFALTDKNRDYLRQFLPWLDRTRTVADTEWFITNSLKGAKEEKCADYGIYCQDTLVGVIGFHSMDYENKKTTIGYWLDKEHQGKGIMTRSVKILINFAFAKDHIVLDLDLSTPVAKIQPTMYGIFFEDINFAADGGLYAELVKNRSFEFEQPMMGWSQPASDPYASNEKSGIAHTLNYAENTTNKNVLRIKLYQGENYTLINEGFRGMGIRKGQTYQLSFYAANIDSTVKAITFHLIDPKDQILATTRIKPNQQDWKRYTAKLVAKKTEEKARLKITFEGNGTLDMDMISLFPADTWKGRPNGVRKDLGQMLADLKRENEAAELIKADGAVSGGDDQR